MATYVRSDIAATGGKASSLFTLLSTYPLDLASVISTSNFASLFLGLVPGIFSAPQTLTNPALVLTDGSQLVLTGSFTFALSNLSSNVLTITGEATVTGTATGLVRMDGANVLETITGASIPFSIDPVAFSYSVGGGLTVGTVVINAPGIEDVINGADAITGGVLDDTLMGFAGADTINGNGGSDTIGVMAGDTAVGETINGGSGTDTLLLGGAVDLSIVSLTSLEKVDFNNPYVTGANSATFLANQLNGTALATALAVTGETGATDSLLFSMGSQLTLNLSTLTFSNWAIDDLVRVDGDADAETVTGSSKSDLIHGGAGTDSLNGGDGDDTLIGNADVFAQEADTLNGGNGADTIFAEFTDIINGGAGTDNLYAVNSFNWSINLGTASIEWMQAAFGNDNIDASSQAAGVTIYGGGGNDVITGGSFADFLWAESGNDTVIGGGGADVIVGDVGLDSLSGGDGNDSIYTDGLDTVLDGGNDTDALYITGGTGLTLDLATSHFEWVGDYANGTDTFNGSGLAVAMVTYAGGGGDNITGGSAGDFLWGEAGNDTIVGGGNADTLVGGTGGDTLTGGTGIDNIFANSGGGGDAAVDTVKFTAVGWGTDFIYDFEHLTDKINMQGTGATAGTISITNVGGHAHVHFGGDLIVVVGAGATLTTADFTF